uniref:Golgin subfamily A member 1 n=1 Tax=Esox lucius TaxID=8010 RepID=A0AAY5KLV3_ESOLU
MFAKLKKKIAEEAATAPRTGVRMPRSYSKESITSAGADSGDDFASDGSSSRDDLSSQILRRNDQIRKLEAKLSDYAEQLRLMQKTKDKLEIALEKHQDSSMRKLQDQNETHQASRARMAEDMALALEKKDQEWKERMSILEQEKTSLALRLDEMLEQSLSLFQKRDDLDELEGFQQQELAKVKHMLLRKEEQLGQRERELQQKEAELHTTKKDLAEAQGKLWNLGIDDANNSLIASVYEIMGILAAVTDEDKERVLLDLQEKVSSLERRLRGNLSEDELLRELLNEKSALEQKLEDTRAGLLEARTNHADTVSSLEAQVNRPLPPHQRSILVETLTLQLQAPEVCETDQNGSVTVDDLDHMQKANRDLEQQLSDKNKTIKQLQQRLAELKRTLQKELRPDRIFPEPTPPPGPAPGPNTTVTNTSDLNDSREINFEYLKHVVLKFMSSREAEAFQLIKAVSVLLNFSREEEDMLKQTLEYKMSWFGSKPSPKGIVRPSVSGAPTHWS